MIFKFTTKELFSDKGNFIKKTIYDLTNMNDQQIMDLVSDDSEACLKID